MLAVLVTSVRVCVVSAAICRRVGVWGVLGLASDLCRRIVVPWSLCVVNLTGVADLWLLDLSLICPTVVEISVLAAWDFVCCSFV